MSGIAGVELVTHELDGVHDVLQVGRGIDAVHALEIAGAADGPLDDRSVVLAEVEADAHGLQRQQDVGEHDGRVEVEAAERLQRDLRRDVRPPAHLHEAHLLADGAVLGQVAAGLAHEPHGRRVDGFAGAGIEKAHWHHLSRWNWLTGTVIVANGSPWAPVDGDEAGRRRLIGRRRPTNWRCTAGPPATRPACILRPAPPCGTCGTPSSSRSAAARRRGTGATWR